METVIQPLQAELLCDSQQQQARVEVVVGVEGVSLFPALLPWALSSLSAPPSRRHPAVFPSLCSASVVLKTAPLSPVPSS